jgi:hypothetical protein
LRKDIGATSIVPEPAASIPVATPTAPPAPN